MKVEGFEFECVGIY